MATNTCDRCGAKGDPPPCDHFAKPWTGTSEYWAMWLMSATRERNKYRDLIAAVMASLGECMEGWLQEARGVSNDERANALEDCVEELCAALARAVMTLPDPVALEAERLATRLRQLTAYLESREFKRYPTADEAELLRKAAEAIAAAQAPAPAWQPIETAPKDGTKVWLWWNGALRLAHWHEAMNPPSIGSRFANWLPDDKGAVPVTVKPTHWMPLPSPPGVAAAPPVAGTPPKCGGCHEPMERVEWRCGACGTFNPLGTPEAGSPAPAEAPRKHCENYSQPWFRGAWLDWHRGHGCHLDDGKPRSPAGRAEIEGYTSPADPGASAPPEERR